VPTLKKKVASPLHEGAVFLILFMNFPFLLETRITFPTQRQRHLAVTVRLMLGSCHFPRPGKTTSLQNLLTEKPKTSPMADQTNISNIAL